MELFFGMELPEHVVSCMLNTPREQFGFHKDSNMTVEDIVEYTKRACLEGKVYIVYDKDVMLFLTDQTPYVLHMDSIRGPKASIFDYSKTIKKVVAMLRDKTEIHKLETRTPFTELDILAKRCKWDLEGTHKQSYQMPDGEFVDEHSYGIIIKRNKGENRCQ
jgi:hypothetical protein